MLCKSCEYPLWKLSARACPECGAPFRPSDFDFRAETVRFCCPHCWQVYYGTDERGHLVPREFDCVKCARRIEMDAMVLVPAAGFEKERATDADVVPWIERKSVGFWRGLWRTIVLGAFAPVRLGEALARDRSRKTGLWYVLVTHFFFWLIGGGVIIILPVTLALVGVAFPGGMGGPGVLGVLVFFGVALGLVLTIPLVALLLWALVAHGVLWVTGPYPGTFRDTVRGLTFTSGANLLQGIPCMGGYFTAVSWIWWAICAGLCLSRAQRVSAVRAIGAMLAFPTLLAVSALSAALFWGVPALRSAMQQAQAAAQRAGNQTQVPGVTSLLKVLVQEEGKGALPAHGVELLMDRRLFPTDFIVGGFSPQMPVVAGMELGAFGGLAEAERAETQAALVKGLGPTGEHRVGDYVLCYQGAWTRSAGGAVLPLAPGLWVVICDPPSPGFGAPAGVTVGHADGVTVRWIGGAQLTKELADQNLLRVSVGLPPLQWKPASPAAAPTAVPPTEPEPAGSP